MQYEPFGFDQFLRPPHDERRSGQERRQLSERRSDRDRRTFRRRQATVPVAEELRSGDDRRHGERRSGTERRSLEDRRESAWNMLEG